MHATKRLVLSIIALAMFVLPVLPTSGAAAQTTAPSRESITLSPTSKKYLVDAGKSVSGELTVVNDGAVGYDFIIYARPYSIVGNDYTNPSFTKVNQYADLYGWVQFPQTRYHIDAGATLKLPYTINVPQGAGPGGHYGVIFAETQPSEGADEANAVIRKKRVGSILYVTVNGQYRDEGTAISTDIPFWQFQPPLHTTTTVKNTGNTDFADTTRLTVRDIFGNKKYEAIKDYQVLPETTRVIALDWDKAPWFGFYKVEVGQKFLDTSTTSEGYVLMMPRYMPIALLVIIIIGVIFYARSRRRKQ